MSHFLFKLGENEKCHDGTYPIKNITDLYLKNIEKNETNPINKTIDSLFSNSGFNCNYSRSNIIKNHLTELRSPNELRE